MDAGSLLTALLDLDRRVFAWLNQADAAPALDVATRWLSAASSPWAVWLWLGLLMLTLPQWRGQPWRRGAREFARLYLLLALVYGLCAASYQALKYAVMRPRPLQQEVTVVLRDDRPPGAVLKPQGPSFPSGHAANAALLGLMFARRWPQARWGIALLVSAAALSRVRQGVHYPLDVLVGATLAWGVGAALLWAPVLRSLWPQRSRTAAACRLRAANKSQRSGSG